jgi:2-polyprenyl-3-methyl-5-hydroxy-6-metoxy-1,4-benzoquinol methylase
MVKNSKRKLTYKFAKYPNDNIGEILDSAIRLENKLSSVDVNKLEISEYNKRYFGDYIRTKEKRLMNLQKYCYILSWVLSGVNKPKDKVVFMDHGGGHGLMSLLAMEHGVGMVVYSDIYSVSAEDAQKIGKSLGLEADIYIPGEIDDVIQYLNKNMIECDAVASYDVIEHIYNIDDFLKKLHLLSSGNMSIFMASAANERNPYIDYKLKSMHRVFEYRDREKKYGRKPTDATQAIIDLRREIIVKYYPKLSSIEVENLTKLTRGLVVSDIRIAVDEYIETGICPYKPLHPTNTCDPYTGNWFEHLMNPDQLTRVLSASGFNSKIICGYYSSPNNIAVHFIKTILNLVIGVMGKKGLFFAPYFVLMAKKK